VPPPPTEREGTPLYIGVRPIQRLGRLDRRARHGGAVRTTDCPLGASDTPCEVDDGEYDQNEDEDASDAVAHGVCPFDRVGEPTSGDGVAGKDSVPEIVRRQTWSASAVVSTFVRAGGWASSLHARDRYPVNLMPDHPSTHASVESQRVEVSVPLRTEYVATLRTMAASLGADAGFSIDEIDDLRLAISEVVSSLADVEGSPHDRIAAAFDVHGEGVTVTITTDRDGARIELDGLAATILDSVVDRYEVDGATVTLTKLASEAATTTAETATDSAAEPITPQA